MYKVLTIILSISSVLITSSCSKEISYGIIYDEVLFNANTQIDESCITYFNTLEDMNADMDLEEPVEELIIKDAVLLQLDVTLSGKEIIGYDGDKPITDQVNIAALRDAGMGGIKAKNKAKRFEVGQDIKLKDSKVKQ